MELGVGQLRWCDEIHGTPWNFSCHKKVKHDVTRFHMELGASIIARPFKSIPWIDDISSSMVFQGTWSGPISRTWSDPWIFMELHGTWSEPISMTWAVPWGGMFFIQPFPLRMTAKRNHWQPFRVREWHKIKCCRFLLHHSSKDVEASILVPNLALYK